MGALASPYLAGSVTESPVGLVLTESDGRRNAMTVSFFSEVSHHPTTLWVSIAKDSLTHALILQSKRFSSIALNERQKELARLCGTVSGRAEDKCARLPLRAHGQHLFLDGALASVACAVRTTIANGDHTLFIADILASEMETLNTMRRHLLNVGYLRAVS
jgi:flavin reductase (DIM6/NTAB) family NADH-FMN oxidoreductase RutF